MHVHSRATCDKPAWKIGNQRTFTFTRKRKETNIYVYIWVEEMCLEIKYYYWHCKKSSYWKTKNKIVRS